MANKVLNGFRWYMKFRGGTNQPVNGSAKLLKRPPKDGGEWKDVTACLNICCDTDELTASDFAVAVTTDPQTGNVITLASAVSSRGNTITVPAYSYVVNGLTIAILTSGVITLSSGATLTTTIVLPITFTDTQGATKTINMTLNVLIP